MSVIDVLVDNRDAFSRGLWVTVQLIVVISFSGLILGSILGIASARSGRILAILLKFSVFVVSSLPVLVVLFWFHYPAQVMLGVVIDPFFTSIFVFSLLNIVSVANIIYNSINELPSQFREAALVCGISRVDIILTIEAPLVLRSSISSLLTSQVSMLHLTLFASLISVEEIFRVSQQVNAQIYKPVEIYTALGIFFLVVCFPVNVVAFLLKKKFGRDLSEK
jgi:His/Glu/Gln/Arg/opine family amino acid ABC transporter permease subunit